MKPNQSFFATDCYFTTNTKSIKYCFIIQRVADYEFVPGFKSFESHRFLLHIMD